MKQTLISQDLDFQKSSCRLKGRVLGLGLTLKTTHKENGTVTKTSPQEMAVSSQPHTVIILGIINSFISNKSYFELNLQHEKTENSLNINKRTENFLCG